MAGSFTPHAEKLPLSVEIFGAQGRKPKNQWMTISTLDGNI